jgi:hypothetical protein
MNVKIVFKGLFVVALLAFSASHGWSAGCIKPPASDRTIGEFKANPQGLIAPDSDTRTVEAAVRDLAGTDATLADDLVRLARGAPPRFQTAIAAGLAQAAIACSNVDQHAALAIQQAVASFEDGQFQASFAAVAGDLSTAATVAATGFANGSVGSVIVVNPNPSRGSTFTPGVGGTTIAPQITSAGAINLVNPNTPSTASATPVSPTR